MSLDKTKKRLERIREINRTLRQQGILLGEPGPWYSLGLFTFDPTAWPGLIETSTPRDTDVWPLTRT